MRFSRGATTTRWTNTDGVSISSGSSSPDLDQLLDLGDRDPPAVADHRVEVARGLPVDEVAEAVGLPRGHEGEVADDAALEDVLPPVEFAGLLPLGDDRAVAAGVKKAGDARAAGADPLGERPLRAELQLELAGQVLPLELGVLPDVGRDHLPDLSLPEEDPEAPVVHAAVVRDAGQSRHVALGERQDEVLGDAAEAEAADDERGAGRDVGHGLRSGLMERNGPDDLAIES